MINIFIVDDHDLVRAGIKQILESFRGLSVIGEASSGEEAVTWCRQHQCDVILMDMSMPGIDGIEATKRILRYNPDARIIMLTVHRDDPIPTQVMKAGACGFITKGATPEETVKAIQEVYAGRRYIEPDVAQMMALERFNGGGKDTYFLLIKQIFSKQIDAKYQLYGTLCIFSVYFITFRKHFRHLLSQNVKYRKKLDAKGKF